MDVLARNTVWLDSAANALGEWLLAPVAVMPGWLSATLLGAASGVLMLVAFKYTSAQRAVKRVRDDINANLLTLKLFRESARVTIQAQGRLLAGAGRLFALALFPVAVMVLPMVLLLGQLSLWYQQRPLRVGEEAVVTVALRGDGGAPFPELSLRPTGAVETIVGPVRAFSKREVCWTLAPRERGYQRLTFQVGGQAAEKELAVGDGFMRVSARRPAWLMYPWEEPLEAGSPVRSIEVLYPERNSWTSGTDWWVFYWFAVSLVGFFAFRRALGVNL
jgi:hypothetical protein